jgi:PAS domain S-box-containing protein
MKQSYNNRFLNGAFAILVIMIASFFFTSWQQAKRITDTNEKVKHTHEVLSALQNIVFKVTDMQTNVRGYIITGQANYLDKTNKPLNDVLSITKDFKALVSQEQTMQQATDSLFFYIVKHIDLTQELIEVKWKGKREEAYKLVASELGQHYIDRIQAIGTQMENEEERLLEERRNENNNSIRNYNILLYSVLFVMGMLSILLFHRIKENIIEKEKNEGKFKALLNAAPDAMIIVNKAGVIKMINHKAMQLLNYSRAELVGKNVELLLPGSINAIESKLFQYPPAISGINLAGEEIELQAMRKDKTTFPVEMSLSMIDAQNEMMVSAAIRDITQRVKSQQQYAQLQQQVEQSSDAIITVDTKLIITNWNQGAEKLFGFTKEEAVGKTSIELLRMNVDEKRRESIEQQVATQGYWTGEVKRITKYNKEIDVLSSVSVIKDKRGVITGFISVNYDLSEQKRLREQVNHLANIVEHSSEAIVSRNFDKKIISWNKGAEQLFGYSSENVLGKTAWELGILKLTPDENIEIDEALNSVGEWQGEKMFYHKSDASFIGEIRANAIMDEAGNLQSEMFIIRDVTSRHRLEEYLRRANEELEEKVTERTEEIYKAESRYRETLDTMLEGVQIIGHDLRYIYINDALAKQVGMKKEELLNRKMTELFPGIDQTNMFTQLINCMKSYKPLQLENEFRFETGVVKYFQLSMQPIPEGIFMLSVDITDKKKAEEERTKNLQEKKLLTERLTAIINTLPANIALLNGQGNIEDVNDAWKKYAVQNNLQHTNYGIGLNYVDVCRASFATKDEDGPIVAEGIRSILDELSAGFEYEYTCHGPHEEGWYRMLVAPIYTSFYHGAVVMHVNITDLKKMERERMRMQIDEQKTITRAMLAGQEKERTQIGIDLHDNITQLLAAIKMKLGLFISNHKVEVPLLQQIMQHLQSVLDQTRNMSHQMVMPKFVSGIFRDEMTNLVSDYGTNTRTAHCNFINFNDEQVAVPVKVALYRIIQEQLHNIDKHASATQVKLNIASGDDLVSMIISDNGKGFDTRAVKKGMGLTNIKNRAEAYGGHVTIISSPGNGCKLLVVLPMEVQ